MKFTNKDGELRIYDGSSGATEPYYLTLLFTNADLTYPLGRGRPEEIINMDRGNVNSDTSYTEGPDDPILEPVPITVSARLEDTAKSGYLRDLLSGVTVINSKSMTTTKGTSSVTVNATSQVSTPAFADSMKVTYNIEILYDSSGGTDFGSKIDEVYFDPGQQTVNESEDSVTININGLIYGNITELTAFTSGTSIENVA